MSRDFYELCYDQYKQEMADADNLYQKAGVMLVIVSLLGTIIVALGRTDIIAQCFVRVDVFLFYLWTFLALIPLATSVLFLVLLSYPRSDYRTLQSINAWHDWRSQYEEYLKQSEPKEGVEIPDNVDKTMFSNLCLRLVEAQPINAKINEKRRKMFQKSMLMAALSLIAISFQALFALILNIQGI
jgi:hypothetical protein